MVFVIGIFFLALSNTLLSINTLIAVVSFIISGIAFVRFLLICGTTTTKWRYYKISIYRLRTRGYKEEYFKYEMYEPCMRLIIKDIFNSFDIFYRYAELYRDFAKKDYRIQDAKDRLLSSFMHND